jgi:hypothetical protein
MRGEQAAELESLLWRPSQFILHHGKMPRFKHSTITKGYCVLKKIEGALEDMGCQLKGLTADLLSVIHHCHARAHL